MSCIAFHFTGRTLVLPVVWHLPDVFVACTQCCLHNAVAHVVSGWSLGVWCVVVSSLSVGGYLSTVTCTSLQTLSGEVNESICGFASADSKWVS